MLYPKTSSLLYLRYYFRNNLLYKIKKIFFHCSEITLEKETPPKYHAINDRTYSHKPTRPRCGLSVGVRGLYTSNLQISEVNLSKSNSAKRPYPPLSPQPAQHKHRQRAQGSARGYRLLVILPLHPVPPKTRFNMQSMLRVTKCTVKTVSV